MAIRNVGGAFQEKYIEFSKILSIFVIRSLLNQQINPTESLANYIGISHYWKS